MGTRLVTTLLLVVCFLRNGDCRYVGNFAKKTLLPDLVLPPLLSENVKHSSQPSTAGVAKPVQSSAAVASKPSTSATTDEAKTQTQSTSGDAANTQTQSTSGDAAKPPTQSTSGDAAKPPTQSVTADETKPTVQSTLANATQQHLTEADRLEDGTKTVCKIDAQLKENCRRRAIEYDTNEAWLANPDEDDVKWFEDCVANYFCFKKKGNSDEWEDPTPTFADDLGGDYMIVAVKRVKQFFVRNNNWDDTKSNANFRVPDGKCTNLLFITAARDLFVVQELYEMSDQTISVCENKKGKIKFPQSHACYPLNYGSQTCTSDYDVGLVGPNSGVITANFNQFFQDRENFGKSSEELFDTNIYAYTLEFAMPEAFDGLSGDFIEGVKSRSESQKFKMAEIASAHFKIFKYDKDFAEQLLNMIMSHLPEQWMKQLKDWYKLFEVWAEKVESVQKPETTGQGEVGFRQRHNEQYQLLVGSVGQYANEIGLDATHMADVMLALIYAAEAYHCTGTIRVVVGVQQMKNDVIKKSLGIWDYWPTMLENWGDALKEFSHCGTSPVEKCLVKMSKYLWRMFDAMKELLNRVPDKDKEGLLDVGTPGGPEQLISYWLINVKKKGRTEIGTSDRLDKGKPPKDYLPDFLKPFKCKEKRGEKLSRECMMGIEAVVGTYDTRMAILIKQGKLKAKG